MGDLLLYQQIATQLAPGDANDNARYENTATTRRQRALLAAHSSPAGISPKNA
jgi:hypothetical protein